MKFRINFFYLFSNILDSDKSVMYIKDRMRVRDSSGKEFDIEMDLKVEIQPARPEIQQRSDTDPNDEVSILSTFYDQLAFS